MEKLDQITWTRQESGFERFLGKYVLQAISEWIQGPHILDVGCGDGLLTKELLRYGNVTGIDGSKEKITLAKKNTCFAQDWFNKKINFHWTLFENFWVDQMFDSIVMIGLLEHVMSPFFILKKARSMINKNGNILIVVPNALSLNRRIGQEMGLIKDCYELTPQDKKIGHQRTYDSLLLENDIIDSGLRIRHFNGIFLKPLSNKQMESWNEQICDALYEIGKELPNYCGMLFYVCVNK